MLHCMLPQRPMAPRAAMWRSGRATPSIATRALAASCDGHRGTARGGQTMRKIGWLILGLAGVLSAPARAACEDSVVLVHGNTGPPPPSDNTYVAFRARGSRPDARRAGKERVRTRRPRGPPSPSK